MRVFEIRYTARPTTNPPSPVGTYTPDVTIVVAEDMNEAAYEFFTDLKLKNLVLNDVVIVERHAGFLQAPVFDGPNAIGERAIYVQERAKRDVE